MGFYQKFSILCFAAILCIFIFSTWRSKNEIAEYRDGNVYVCKLKENRMVMQKNAALIPEYYHKDLLLYTNGQEMNYDAF